jgi:hypothetical protein
VRSWVQSPVLGKKNPLKVPETGTHLGAAGWVWDGVCSWKVSLCLHLLLKRKCQIHLCVCLEIESMVRWSHTCQRGSGEDHPRPGNEDILQRSLKKLDGMSRVHYQSTDARVQADLSRITHCC